MKMCCENCKFTYPGKQCINCYLERGTTPKNWVPARSFNPEYISERVVCEIIRRTGNDRKKQKEELENLGASRRNYHNWKEHLNEPQSYFIAKMAKAGYDVYYILTGVRKHYG